MLLGTLLMNIVAVVVYPSFTEVSQEPFAQGPGCLPWHQPLKLMHTSPDECLPILMTTHIENQVCVSSRENHTRLSSQSQPSLESSASPTRWETGILHTLKLICPRFPLCYESLMHEFAYTLFMPLEAANMQMAV